MMKFKRLAAVCSALLMALLCACSVPADSTSAPVSQQKAKDGELAVHFLDVGQGDSEFIELPGGETMLIDAGEQEYGKTVSDYISSLGYSEITYLVATHPHSDHIGGLPEVLDTFDVFKCLYAGCRLFLRHIQFFSGQSGCRGLHRQSGGAVRQRDRGWGSDRAVPCALFTGSR